MFLYFFFFFFFNDTATTEIYTLSLHDALPIWFTGKKWVGRNVAGDAGEVADRSRVRCAGSRVKIVVADDRSEEHTSELQSQSNLVCRLLLEKKKKRKMTI